MVKGLKAIAEAFSLKNIVIGLVVIIFLVQIISLMLNKFFPTIEVFKTGNLLFIISVLLTAITLVNVVFRNEFNRNDFVAIFIMAGITASIWYFGGKFLPEIFSVIGNQALTSAQSIFSFP